jgi:RNA polymerase sigma-54 factor
MIELRLQADITQTLELLLSPRLLQMLKILNLPYLELVNRISQESEENVMLEVERKDEFAEFIRYLTSDKKIRKEADFTELPGLENIGRVEKTLEQHLLEQLEMEDIEESYKEIGKEIIGNIDDRGYLLAYPQLREKIMQRFEVSRPTVDKVLKIVQGFEPEGVGARDLKECLKIQLADHNFENEALEEIIGAAIDKHLDDIGNGEFGKVSKALGIPESGAAEIGSFIKDNLNPYPGSSFGGETRQVIPSFAVEKAGKGYKVICLEERYGPLIRLSPEYLKMLENPKTDQKTRDFLKEKLKRAKELIEDFGKRSETLGKIIRKIVESQERFLDKGVIWLDPLSQKSLAAEFGLHPSTISRAVAEKYIQTPQGLFPLKFLCPRGPKGTTAARLKAMIVEVIKGEDKCQPLPDEKIAAALKERGASLDRRTVAYYRKELKIPSRGERVNK